ANPSWAQQPIVQTPSPMVDKTRPHPRIAQSVAVGRRVDLKSLKGARLFIGRSVDPNRPVSLIVHFHVAPWLIEMHIPKHLKHAALITVKSRTGSNAYRPPFEQPEQFQLLIDEEDRELGLKHSWFTSTLTVFSASYGAVREILRQQRYFAMINNVLFQD